MNGSRLISPAVTAGDGYGLARVVVAVRVAVVVSVVGLAALGPEWMRRHPVALTVVLLGALAYSAVLMTHPRFEVRRTRYGWLVSALDATFTLALIGLTGGASSPVVAALALVVIASAARLTLAECLTLAAFLAIGYLSVVLMTDSSPQPMPSPWVQGLWWAMYVGFIAMLSGGLAVFGRA